MKEEARGMMVNGKMTKRKKDNSEGEDEEKK